MFLASRRRFFSSRRRLRAPSANFTINGGPDITGAIVCKNFYANGNIHWHYDRRLDTEGVAVDYRIVSYVEDIR